MSTLKRQRLGLMMAAELTQKNPLSVGQRSLKERIISMRNSTITLLLDQLRRESQKQKEEGDLKDADYQKISELISQIERAFTNG